MLLTPSRMFLKSIFDMEKVTFFGYAFRRQTQKITKEGHHGV
jgi:hypothetical protein